MGDLYSSRFVKFDQKTRFSRGPINIIYIIVGFVLSIIINFVIINHMVYT